MNHEAEDRALPERAAADAKDAQRYRWLRDYAGVFYNDVFNDIVHFDTIDADSANLDAAIDAAIAAQAPSEGPQGC